METLGKYALLEQLNSGETSDIFFAKPLEGTSDGLVVKRLKPLAAENKEYHKAFMESGKLSSQLRHANTSTVTDFGTVEGVSFLVRQYAPGKDLKNLSRRHSIQRRLVPQPVTLHLMRVICDALEQAHKIVVHGCLTPSDIIIGFGGEIKLINFGMGGYFSRLASTQGALSKDKSGYLSPEHVTGGKIDQRSDIFSLGLVFYELLTGNPVFPEGLDNAALEATKKKAITPPSGVRPSISTGLDAVVMKALELDPAKRFANTGEFKKALEGLSGEGIEVGSTEDVGSLMNRIFPNEAVIERERKAQVVPKDLAKSSAKNAGAPAAKEPAARPGPERQKKPSTVAAPVVSAPAESPEEQGGKSKGLIIGIGVAVVAVVVIVLFFVMGKKEEPKPEVTVATASTNEPGEKKATPEPTKIEPPSQPPSKTGTPSAKSTVGTAEPTATTEPPDVDQDDTSTKGGAKGGARKTTKHVTRPPVNRQPPRKTETKIAKADPTPAPQPPVSPTRTEPTKTATTSAQPAVTPAAQPTTGFLKVISATPVDVEVDGWRAPVTGGQLNLKLAPGPHKVKVIFKETGRSFVRDIDIAPGKTKVLRLVSGQ